MALGGSIMYPDKIDVGFLKNFKKFVTERLAKGNRFLIVVGGGRVARIYQEAAHKFAKVTSEDKDWIGIHATRTNAHLLRVLFRDVADPVVIDERYKMKALKHKVTIASGWRPGWSTDYVAVALAADFKAGTVIIAGKPDHVYDKDPAKYKNAKVLENLSWTKYRKLIPRKWEPGAHSPVDPVASALAQKEKITAVILNGRDLKNLSMLLDGKKFNGTSISN